MVSRCANPECGAPFLYLREGRLIAVRRGEGRHGRVEFFWLCGACTSRLTLETGANCAGTLVALAENTRDRDPKNLPP